MKPANMVWSLMRELLSGGLEALAVIKTAKSIGRRLGHLKSNA